MLCDKCNTEVPPENDATLIHAYGFNEPLAAFIFNARHFFPVYDESGNLICEGSPSRAQYIEGQPRDTRGYEYHPEHESSWREGLRMAQEYARTESD
jgi:hypothetical protein